MTRVPKTASLLGYFVIFVCSIFLPALMRLGYAYNHLFVNNFPLECKLREERNFCSFTSVFSSPTALFDNEKNTVNIC